jgi:hypothetical protein
MTGWPRRTRDVVILGDAIDLAFAPTACRRD